MTCRFVGLFYTLFYETISLLSHSIGLGYIKLCKYKLKSFRSLSIKTGPPTFITSTTTPFSPEDISFFILLGE